MDYSPYIVASAVGYLLGSVPNGYLVAKAHGVDIFKVGSGNPGATNVKRVLGEKFGDKGRRAGNLAAAVLGHSFSLFTKFKGGKGVATAAGGLVVLIPLACLIGTAVWVIAFYTTRFVSLGSILAAIVVPTASWVLGNPLPLNIVTTLIGLFVIFRHRENLKRLLNGTENRSVKKTASMAEKAKPDA